MESTGRIGWRHAFIREQRLEKLDQHFVDLAQRHPNLFLALAVFGMPVIVLAGIFLALMMIFLPFALML